MIEKLRDTFAAVSDDALAIAQLEVEVNLRKLVDYDLLTERVASLRRVISTLEGNVEDMIGQIDSRDERYTKLQQEYEALKARLDRDSQTQVQDDSLALFKALEPLATRLPTLLQAVNEGATVTIDDFGNLLASLNQALAIMGFAAIGQAGGVVKFDRERHRAVGKGARSVETGDSVKVRYVGYSRDGKVIAKAHVTAV